MKKLFALSLIVAASCQTWVSAADFPFKDKPVTIVVPFVAGGPTDRVARDLAEAMRKPLGTTVVVEKDRKSTRLNSSHIPLSRMPSSA